MVPLQITKERKAELEQLHSAAPDKYGIKAGVSVTANVATRDTHKMLIGVLAKKERRVRMEGRKREKLNRMKFPELTTR